MFKNIRNLLVGLAVAATFVAVPVAVSSVASADSIRDSICEGVNSIGDAGDAGCNNNAGPDKVKGLVNDIVTVFSWVVGIASVIMIIFGGFRYVTSGGDSSKITSAKNTIIYAIIGLVVVAMAQFIVQFVVNKVNSGN